MHVIVAGKLHEANKINITGESLPKSKQHIIHGPMSEVIHERKNILEIGHIYKLHMSSKFQMQ